ncbi:polysaccharide biosynthesis C-terminal domain-containing protein [Halorarum halobium]|uniref:oligosaccharide flippase family protein n=1 Tax=Halorarum halobium TaxID=3075121 RepID=UPI0028A79107|nr:polysaccharide biosynthesis C-terminal domain-containing protein [Halobaculum sp. XH14]
MRLGQKSAIFFASKIGSSVLGFFATVYFARELGSAILGDYFLVLAVVGWLTIVAKAGITKSITKRVSEGVDKSQHIVAGAVLILALTSATSTGIFLFRGQINQYLGAPLYWVVILLLFGRIGFSVVMAVFRGDHLVHIEAALGISQSVSRITLQVAGVAAGLSIFALLGGEIVSFISVGLAAIILLPTLFGRSLGMTVPDRSHFSSITNFAKYSWLERAKGGTYSLMDKLVLGFFVSSSLIGIYSICWNIATVMGIFSKSLSSTFFPEMSRLSGEAGRPRIVNYLDDTLAFSGLFVIPGFVGSVVVGEGVLNLYGSEFRQGYAILVLLVASILVHSYYRQVVSTIDALDRPDLSFQANILFVGSNIVLNFLLVFYFGWLGAAVATLVSVVCGFVFAYFLLGRILTFTIPWKEIRKQVVAAIIMGLLVKAVLYSSKTIGASPFEVRIVIPAVTFGATVYFGLLFLISGRFRLKVTENIPVQ